MLGEEVCRPRERVRSKDRPHQAAMIFGRTGSFGRIDCRFTWRLGNWYTECPMIDYRWEPSYSLSKCVSRVLSS